MKIRHGADFLPCSNKSRTPGSPTPTNISTKCELKYEKKSHCFSRNCSSQQGTPVPGGPIIRTPLGTLCTRLFIFLWIFQKITSANSSLASSHPTTFLNVTFPLVSVNIFTLIVRNSYLVVTHAFAFWI